MTMTPRFKTRYSEEIIAKLQEEFNYRNIMMVPKLEKIVVSQGVGAAVADTTCGGSAGSDDEFLKA